MGRNLLLCFLKSVGACSKTGAVGMAVTGPPHSQELLRTVLTWALSSPTARPALSRRLTLVDARLRSERASAAAFSPDSNANRHAQEGGRDVSAAVIALVLCLGEFQELVVEFL